MDGDKIADRIASDVVSAKEGPVNKILGKYWNTIHDIEQFLGNSLQEYDVSASYSGSPAERDSKDMMKEINSVIKKLESLSMKDFARLADKERKFVGKYGTPEEYAEKVRAEMFPN